MCPFLLTLSCLVFLPLMVASLGSITFNPPSIKKVIEGQPRSVSVLISDLSEVEINKQHSLLLTLVSEDENVASVMPYQLKFIPETDSSVSTNFTVVGTQVGKTSIRWKLRGHNPERNGTLDVSVIRKPDSAQLIFTITVSILVLINNINMGCLIDLQTIRRVLMKPVAPIIGFCSQFIFMPLGSYGVGLLLFPDRVAWRLGLFTLGCCPGGTGSNFWTILFDGDVDLSVTMTFISTIAAMGMMPFWMFTLGAKLLHEGNLTVPYVNLLTSLIFMTVPLLIGVAIQTWRESWALFLKKILKPFTIVVIVVIVAGGTYISLYVFRLMTWSVIYAGLAVAMGGYFTGALSAFFAGLNRKQIVAVSIETALQNSGIAFVLLQLSLEQPESDLAAVPIVGQIFMTSIPLWCVYMLYALFKKICPSYSNKKNTELVSAPLNPPLVLRENKMYEMDRV